MIEDLSIQDQKLAKFKINKFSAINNYDIIDIQTERHDFIDYVPIIILAITIMLLIFLKKDFFQKYILHSKIGMTSLGFLICFSTIIACSKSSTSSSGNNSSTNNPIDIKIPKTNVLFIDSAFASFKPALSTTWDSTYFYISSTGIPNHNMMIGITSWQQQVPVSHPYNGTNSWSIPLQPVYSTMPISTKNNLMKGAVAVAVNGIPIFNALNNRGEDSYKIGELDNWGGIVVEEMTIIIMQHHCICQR